MRKPTKSRSVKAPAKQQKPKSAKEPRLVGLPDRAWFDEKMRDRGLRVGDMRGAIGVHANVWPRIMSGERGLAPGEALVFSSMLQMPLSEVLRRMGYDVQEPTTRIIGEVLDNGRVRFVPPAEQEVCPMPQDTSAGLVALRVTAEHTALQLYNGNTLYYAPADGVAIDAFGRLAVLEIGDDMAPLVGALDRASLGRGTIVVFGTGERVEAKRLISASPIRWIRAG